MGKLSTRPIPPIPRKKLIIIEEVPSQECGRFIGINKDDVKGTIWVYAERGIFKYKVDKEDRNIWLIYLEDGKFEKAKEYCKYDEVAFAYVMIKEEEKNGKRRKEQGMNP